MGGHGDARGSGRYVAIAALGRALARSGLPRGDRWWPGTDGGREPGRVVRARTPTTTSMPRWTSSPAHPPTPLTGTRFVSVAGTVRERWPARGRQPRRADLGVRRRADQRVLHPCREVLHQQHPRRRPAGARPRRCGVRTRRRRHRAGDLHRRRAEHQHAVRGAQPDGVPRARRSTSEAEPELRRRGPAPGRSASDGPSSSPWSTTSTTWWRSCARTIPIGRRRHRGPRRRRRPGRTLTDAPLRLAASAAELADDFARVRHDLAVPTGFDADVDRRGRRASRARRPPAATRSRRSAARRARPRPRHRRPARRRRDLDQAFHAERSGTGYRVHYAIADVAAFVAPGGALDREAFARGESRCTCPTAGRRSIPTTLGEGAASLLPEVDRPALLWTFELDAGANACRDAVRPGHGAQSRRALVRRGPAFARVGCRARRRSPSCGRSACTCSTASGSGAA